MYAVVYNYLLLSLTLFFGRFGMSAIFLDLTLLLDKTAVVLFYDNLRFVVSCHKRLHIRITVLF